MRERKGFGFFALFLTQTRGLFNNFFSLESALQHKKLFVVIIIIAYF